MSQMTNYMENKVLDHALGVASWTMPTNVYLALHTADPTEVGNVSEVATGGYARQPCVFNAASGGATANSADEEFAASGANFGTVSHWSIWDALTVGNCLIYGAFAASKVINDGDTARIAAGELDLVAA